MLSRKRHALSEEEKAAKILAESDERVRRLKRMFRALAGAFLISKNMATLSNLYYDDKVFTQLRLRAGQLFIHLSYIDFVCSLESFVEQYPHQEHKGRELVELLVGEDERSRGEIINLLLYNLDESNVLFTVDLWNHMHTMLLLSDRSYAHQNWDSLNGARSIVEKFGKNAIVIHGLVVKRLRYTSHGYACDFDEDSGVEDTDCENSDAESADAEDRQQLNVLGLKHILKFPREDEEEMRDVIHKLCGCFVVDGAPLTELPEQNVDNVLIHNHLL